MRKRLLYSACPLVGLVILAMVTGCSNNDSGAPAKNGGHAGNATSGGQGGNTSSAQGGTMSAQGGMSSAQGGATSGQGGMTGGHGGATQGNAGCDPNTGGSPVVIDDMETTDHGPIQFMGVSAPLSPGYWYNSGANYVPSGGAGAGGGGMVLDTSDPPQGSFTFSALPAPTKTLNCTNTSEHAARQKCTLNGLYDTCGVGFEFAQQPDPNAAGAGAGGNSGAGGSADLGGGAGAAASGAGAGGAGAGAGGAGAGAGAGGAGASAGGASAGAGTGTGGAGAAAGGAAAGMAGAGPAAGAAGAAGGPSVPMVTVPFDISHYKAVTFWGMTTTPDAMTGTLQVKVSFPDTDTDPRGQICNGGGGNTSKCYNSYASTLGFTTSWQQFTVLLDAGTNGVPPAGGIAIDPSWGYQGAQWLPTQVYGINWQAQKNTDPGSGPPLTTEIWVDDVYFIQ